MKGIDVYVEEAPQNRGVSILRVSGYVDTTTSPDLERRLQALLRDRRYHVVVDLTRVEYISSAGWGIFISEIREIREHGGDLKLAGMIPDVKEVFDLLEFENILQACARAQLTDLRHHALVAPAALQALEARRCHAHQAHTRALGRRRQVSCTRVQTRLVEKYLDHRGRIGAQPRQHRMKT